VRAFAGHEGHLHHLDGCVIDENQQRAGLASLLESAVATYINLYKLTTPLATETLLVKTLALSSNLNAP
jgi:hypothetical protein